MMTLTSFTMYSQIELKNQVKVKYQYISDRMSKSFTNREEFESFLNEVIDSKKKTFTIYGDDKDEYHWMGIRDAKKLLQSK